MKGNAGLGRVVLCGFVLGLLVHCIGSNRDILPIQKRGAVKTEDTRAGGKVVMAGSTAMEKLADILAESFMEDYPNVTVTVEFTGSSAGIESVLQGRADIGNASRGLREEEIAAGAVENVVAIDGIAVITHFSNRVSHLTLPQLTEIYAGRIRNWRELGGADEPIVVVGREAGSGTRSTFEELLGMADQCAYANEIDSSGAVMARVAATPGAIGYVSADIPDATVQVMALDDRLPTPSQVQDGSYPLRRPFVMVTDGPVIQQSASVREFFAYIWSDEGKRLIESAGLAAAFPDVTWKPEHTRWKRSVYEAYIILHRRGRLQGRMAQRHGGIRSAGSFYDLCILLDRCGFYDNAVYDG